MKPAELDAVEAAALRDAPHCAACGALATRACVGCHSTWCGSHDGTAGAPPCPDGMAPLREDVRLTLARALREAWAERDAARVASAPSEREAMLRAALDNREAFARDLTAVVGAAERERDALREQLAALAAALRDHAGPCGFCGRGGSWCCAERSRRAADVLRSLDGVTR